METFAMDPTPQMFQPMVDLMRNKNFAGAPIIPEYLEDVEPQEQYQYYTSESMIVLGRKLGISPIEAEYLVRGYLGTLGTWALGASDYAVTDLLGHDPMGSGESPDWDIWRENVLMQPFVKKGPLKRTKSETDFYDMLKITRITQNTMNLMRDRDPERVEAYLEDPEVQTFLSLAGNMNEMASKLSELRKIALSVRQSKELNAKEKREELDHIQRERNNITRNMMQFMSKKKVREISEKITNSPKLP